MGMTTVTVTKEVSVRAEELVAVCKNAVGHTYKCFWVKQVENGKGEIGCKAELNSQAALWKHILIHLRIARHKRDLVCHWHNCGKPWKTSKNFEHHVKAHSEQIFCIFPGCEAEVALSPDDLVYHLKSYHLHGSFNSGSSTSISSLPGVLPTALQPPPPPDLPHLNIAHVSSHLITISPPPFEIPSLPPRRPIALASHNHTPSRLESPSKPNPDTSSHSSTPGINLHLEDLPSPPHQSFWDPGSKGTKAQALVGSVAMTQRQLHSVTRYQGERTRDLNSFPDIISAPPACSARQQRMPRPWPKTIHTDIFQKRVAQFRADGGLSEDGQTWLMEPPPLQQAQSP